MFSLAGLCGLAESLKLGRIIFVLNLGCAVCFASSSAVARTCPQFGLPKTSNQEMHFDRSVYIRTEQTFPLGEDKSFRLLGELAGPEKLIREDGNFTIEVRAGLRDVTSNRVEFGKFRPGTLDSMRAWFAAIHNSQMTITLKLVLTDLNGDGYLQPTPANLDEFLASYLSFLSFYTKVATLSGVEELVIGTGLEGLVVQNPAVFEKIILSLRGSCYSGRIRLDFISPASYEMKITQIPARLLQQIDQFGVDLPLNPEPSELNLLSEKVVLARASFGGNSKEQNEKIGAFFSEAFRRRLTGEWTAISWGVFPVNPTLNGPLDLTDSVRGKPALETIRPWFGM